MRALAFAFGLASNCGSRCVRSRSPAGGWLNPPGAGCPQRFSRPFAALSRPTATSQSGLLTCGFTSLRFSMIPVVSLPIVAPMWPHSAAPPAGAPSPNLALDSPRYPANHGPNADPLQELWSWDTLPRSVSAPMTRTSTKVDEGSQGPRMLHASAVTTEPGFGPRQARPFSALARERPLRYRGSSGSSLLFTMRAVTPNVALRSPRFPT
jgi:hypothetical protein